MNYVLIAYYTGVVVSVLYVMVMLCIPSERRRVRARIEDQGVFSYNFTTLSVLTLLAALCWPVLAIDKMITNKDRD